MKNTFIKFIFGLSLLVASQMVSANLVTIEAKGSFLSGTGSLAELTNLPFAIRVTYDNDSSKASSLIAPDTYVFNGGNFGGLIFVPKEFMPTPTSIQSNTVAVTAHDDVNVFGKTFDILEFILPYSDGKVTLGLFYDGVLGFGKSNFKGGLVGVNNTLNQIGSITGFIKPSDIKSVPVPSAIWLFASGLFGFIGFVNRKQK